ncbi:MAG TPA: T9SS type A sorting domain-containing protein, partial [Bacteroides sp.]|nr:T9SS type A sorting domain-containing protein [Bacteroides sp.]
AWYSAKSYNLTVKNLFTEDNWDNAADFSGSYKVMHDLDNIYVLLDVKDDTLDTESNNAWERDHWSVYFDMSNIKQNGALLDDKAEPMDSVQFMLEKVWSVEGDINLGLAINNDTLKWDVDFAEMIDSGSHYVLEVAVPFSEIGVTLTEGMVIGYDTKIGDNDGDGQLDHKLSWHQSADEGWHNAAYLGNMSIDPVFFDLGPLSPAPAQIEVDGVEDGDWTHAIAMPLERKNLFTEANWDNAADFSGVIKALWDPDNFYVLLKVQDDILETVANNAWERDHYSVYFDISNIKQDGDLLDDHAEPMDSVQFMLEKIWSVEGDINLGLAINRDTLKWGVDFVEVIDTGTSYMLELVVPFSDIGVTLSQGMVIGWDAKIGDNDGAGQLDHKLAWNQLADEGWHNASYLGEVELMPNGTIFGTPVEEITTADVTFNVDMNGMIAAELFDPAADFVDIAGSFNNWGDPVVQAADTDADGIYTYVLAEQEFGTELQFKFRVNGQWDPISEFPSGGPNRVYTVVDGENVVNVVFNDGDYSPWIESVETDEAASLQIYPNPARDALHIFSRTEIRSVSITNLVGQSVLNVPVNRAVTSIDISTLDRGVYIVSVQFESQVVTNSVFVKQ